MKKSKSKATAVTPMKKPALFETLGATQEMTKRQVRDFLEALRDLTFKELKRCGVFVLPDMGKFNLKERKARMGRNPATGESIKIKAKTNVKFRVSKTMKDAVLPAVKK